MTTIQIQLKDVYVETLLAVISSHKEIPIEHISVDNPAKRARSDSKARLLQIAQECAALPTLDQRSTEQILGYADNDMGLWDAD